MVALVHKETRLSREEVWAQRMEKGKPVSERKKANAKNVSRGIAKSAIVNEIDRSTDLTAGEWVRGRPSDR